MCHFVFRVTSDSTNMFRKEFDFTMIDSWPFHVCVCELCNDANSCKDLTGTVPCKKNAVATCSKGKPVGKDTCGTTIRSRRSLRRDPGIPVVKMHTYSTDHHRIKVCVSNGVVLIY